MKTAKTADLQLRLDFYPAFGGDRFAEDQLRRGSASPRISFAEDQLQNGRLAGAVLADQADPLAGLKLKTERRTERSSYFIVTLCRRIKLIKSMGRASG
jgi:hypothetical protein